ncbi:hypothetical protein ACTOVL_04160 [Arcanobacterium canis]
MELNARINAFNKLAEAACAIAQSLEQEAWEHCDHGFAPTSAAELVTPALLEQLPPTKRPAPKPEPVAEPAVEATPTAEAPEPEVSLVDVRTALATASQAGHTDQVRALIEEAGASRLSDVDPSKYGWLLARVQEIS